MLACLAVLEVPPEYGRNGPRGKIQDDQHLLALLDGVLSRIGDRADERLAFQASFPIHS
ncbi:hypothetical protein GCM10023193_43600 [Planotetraspora kaengkrachanensis]|uniref:Uncharacterized protein n=2 Tax=Planotetraspora kaengkrachanensis TaxID=575193 RepID=A0A8J3LX53_9ACTN|nr:hypothetical protein Pka01_34640 [Planotetraspora kaengkrachanensis]